MSSFSFHHFWQATRHRLVHVQQGRRNSSAAALLLGGSGLLLVASTQRQQRQQDNPPSLQGPLFWQTILHYNLLSFLSTLSTTSSSYFSKTVCDAPPPVMTNTPPSTDTAVPKKKKTNDATPSPSSSPSSSSPLQLESAKDPSWWRRTLYHWGVVRHLPLPRPVRIDDPALQISKRLQRQRVHDDQHTLPLLQQRIAVAVQARDTHTAQAAISELYQTLYGVSPQARTDFLLRYGCTGWNDQILETLTQLASNRGMVEIGAGHGQWARALQEYRQVQWQRTGKADTPLFHPRTLVRAYDNGSQLPLNPAVYHARTQPHQAYFGTVLPCADLTSCLAQFENRGRILLLVYPPPDSNLAVDALRTYTAVDPIRNDIVVYVGEGRGGATANNAFFETLAANGTWYVTHILPGVPCGTKGHDQVFVFQKADDTTEVGRRKNHF